MSAPARPGDAPDLSALAGRIAVVTGATEGIGAALAKLMADSGAHVIAIDREVEALERLDDAIKAGGGEATLVPIDLTDGPGIDRLGAAVDKRWGRLDILAGCAGALGRITPLTHIPAPVFQQTLDTNLSANWRLLRTLYPVLRQSDAGRAVFLTAAEAVTHRPNWGASAISRAALEAMVAVFTRETRSGTFAANLVDPGPVATRERAISHPGDDPKALAQPEDVAPAIAALCLPTFKGRGERIALQAPTAANATDEAEAEAEAAH